MRNQKWNEFKHNDVDIPANSYEAGIFLNNSIRHLFNRSSGPLGESFEILNSAMVACRHAMVADALNVAMKEVA